MKRFFALLLTLLLMFSLCACGKTGGNGEDLSAGERMSPNATGQEGSDDAAVQMESADLSAFTFGVAEDGDDVVVTMKNSTEAGEAVSVMTYVYKDGKLTKAAADYYVPDSKMAEALAEQLKQDSSIVSDSVKADGTCVSCRIAEGELEELRLLSREELIEAMKYAIANAQGQAAE